MTPKERAGSGQSLRPAKGAAEALVPPSRAISPVCGLLWTQAAPHERGLSSPVFLQEIQPEVEEACTNFNQNEKGAEMPAAVWKGEDWNPQRQLRDAFNIHFADVALSPRSRLALGAGDRRTRFSGNLGGQTGTAIREVITKMNGKGFSEEVTILAASERFVEFTRKNFLEVGNHILLLNISVIILNIKVFGLAPAIS